MPKIHLSIPYPSFIERLGVAIVLRHRKKHFGCAFRRIKLTKGKFAIVDPEDYQKLSQDDWQLFETENKKCYAARIEGIKIVYMHRVIMNAPKGSIVDHRDKNGLNNTKDNLRFATRSQNSCNRKRLNYGSSKYRGVCRGNECNKWRAYISFNGQRKYLGYFKNEEDAAKAYDEAAKIYHGEFAVLNFNDDSHEDSKTQKEGGFVLNTLYDEPNRNEQRNRWPIYDILKYLLLDVKILLFIISFLYIFAIK